MDTLVVTGVHLSPIKNFDQIVDFRAEKREYLRGKNNVTSCRSPTRDLDTRSIQNELKEKRQQEFLRRRSVSPELSTGTSSGKKAKSKTRSIRHYSSGSKSGTLHTNKQSTPTSNGRPLMVLTPNSNIADDLSTNKYAAMLEEPETLTSQTKSQSKKQTSTSTLSTMDSNQHRKKSMERRNKSANGQKTTIISPIQAEQSLQNFSIQSENILQKLRFRENSAQTESGLVTVRESDIQMLSDLLQEALWREDALKKKLAAVQESTTNLMNSSNKIWTAHCSEDLLKNKITALEAQLQICLQKFPKDGVKQVVIQMEKQKWVYEEKAKVALMKITEEKSEALSMAETLQEAFSTSKSEAERWQRLYEELKLSSAQLREKQHLSNEQLQQLHSQVELFRAREDELRKEVVLLRQENKELRYNISLLEEDNQALREEIQHLTDGSDETQGLMMQGLMTSVQTAPAVTVRRDSQVEEQLRYTQEKLRLKEKECEELQTELHTMEQECQSSQARLSQCREELRQLSPRSRTPTSCSSWWKFWLFFLLLLTAAQVAMLWLWYPPFREQAEDLYSDIETRVEDYLAEMASPRHSGCFRPI